MMTRQGRESRRESEMRMLTCRYTEPSSYVSRYVEIMYDIYDET